MTDMDMKNSDVGPGADAGGHDHDSQPFDGDRLGRLERGEGNGPEP